MTLLTRKIEFLGQIEIKMVRQQLISLSSIPEWLHNFPIGNIVDRYRFSPRHFILYSSLHVNSATVKTKCLKYVIIAIN